MIDRPKHSLTGPHPDLEVHALMPFETEGRDTGADKRLGGELTGAHHISDHLFAAVQRLVTQGDVGERSKYARGLRDEIVLPGGELSPEELATRDRVLAAFKRLPWTGEIHDLAEVIRMRTLMQLDNIEGGSMGPVLEKLADMTREQLRKGTPYSGTFDTYPHRPQVDPNRRVILENVQSRPELIVRQIVSECPNEGRWYTTSDTVSRWTGAVEGLQVSPADNGLVRIQGRLQWEVLKQELGEPGIY